MKEETERVDNLLIAQREAMDAVLYRMQLLKTNIGVFNDTLEMVEEQASDVFPEEGADTI